MFVKSRSWNGQAFANITDLKTTVETDLIRSCDHITHSLRLKMANGQVAGGDCSPPAPTDPYVPTLEHTAPHHQTFAPRLRTKYAIANSSLKNRSKVVVIQSVEELAQIDFQNKAAL